MALSNNVTKTTQGTAWPVKIVGGSEFGRYAKINPSKTYNMYISDDWLINFAGYKQVSAPITPALGSGRGAFHSVRGKFILAVMNSAVYRFDENLYPTKIGNIESQNGEVFIAENLSNQICIVDGTNAYIYYHLSGPNLTKQTLPSTLSPTYVDYQDTFFLMGNGNNTTDGAKWYAFEYATDTTITQNSEMALQTKPDYAVAVKRLPGQSSNVLVFGRSVCEIFTHVGGTQNYVRNSTRSIDYGVLSIPTIASSDTMVAWLASNESNSPVIMTYSEGGNQAISTDGIDTFLSNLNYPELSTASMYRLNGHLFYQISFTHSSDNITLIYDFNTKKFFHLSDGNLNYHPARQVVNFNNNIYFVSLNDTSLYEMSGNLYTYDENIPGQSESSKIWTIPSIRITPTMFNQDTARFRVNLFTLILEQGADDAFTQLGDENYCSNFIVTEGAFEDPIVTETGDFIVAENRNIDCLPYQPRIDLSVSSNSGITFSPYASRVLNYSGHYQNILQWQNMGLMNSCTLKLRFLGRSRWVVNNAQLEVF